MANPPYAYIIAQSSNNGFYNLWRFDPSSGADPLQDPVEIPAKPSGNHAHQLVPIGNYILDWVPSDGTYQLWQFDPQLVNPLHGPVRSGQWPDLGPGHHLVSIANFILDWVPSSGSSPYKLWQFDPQSDDPLNPLPGSGTPPVSDWPTWKSIHDDHKLLPMGNFVIDLVPGQGTYRLWQFDPQSPDHLPSDANDEPAYGHGVWPGIDTSHEFASIGSYVLDWAPDQQTYKLWRFDFDPQNPEQNPLQEIQHGSWTIGSDQTLVGIQPVIPISVSEPAPGTMGFMRSKIKHVVYYMLENRSFDSVCGWLYDNPEAQAHFIPPGGSPFQGLSKGLSNPNQQNQPVPVSLYNDGKLSHSDLLEIPTAGADHNHIPVLEQLFLGAEDISQLTKNQGKTELEVLYGVLAQCAYMKEKTPEMKGFVQVQELADWGNSPDQIMSTYSTEQLPILNGLAQSYAISDQWFSSFPGPTDVNRAFALTGSSFGRTTNFEGGSLYQDWPSSPHRPPLWYVLWAFGFDDWKIYYQDNWDGFCYTDQLFLKGHIPTVDKDVAADKEIFVCPFSQFLDDTKPPAEGSKEPPCANLPRFSFIEPAWLGGTDPSLTANSYHPPSDLVPGEETLNLVYNRLKSSGCWDETLLIITFDEHGGIYDHVAPPRGSRPYLNDFTDGFKFDLFGVRVPTILVSPWVTPGTVFRPVPTAENPSPVYDSTSILATILSWYGIPKEQWGLGGRVASAPTFESVLDSATAQGPPPPFTPPYDREYPNGDFALNDLHRTFVPRVVAHLTRGELDGPGLKQVTDEILSKATNLRELHAQLRALQEKYASG